MRKSQNFSVKSRNFRRYFRLFLKIRQIFPGSELLMGKTKLDETYIFKINIKMQFL